MKNLKKMSLNLATKKLSRKELKKIMAGNEDFDSLESIDDSLESLESPCRKTSACSSKKGVRHGSGNYTCC